MRTWLTPLSQCWSPEKAASSGAVVSIITVSLSSVFRVCLAPFFCWFHVYRKSLGAVCSFKVRFVFNDSEFPHILSCFHWLVQVFPKRDQWSKSSFGSSSTWLIEDTLISIWYLLIKFNWVWILQVKVFIIYF